MDQTQTESAATTKPDLNEIATMARDITYPAYFGRLINRDDTLITRGQGKGLKIYDDIERDAHAYALLQKRKLAVVAQPWELIPASDAPLDKKAAAIVKAQLQGLNFDQLTLDLLDALLKGFSIGEVMWDVVGTELVARRVIARDQRRFVFDPEYRLRMLTLENLMRGEPMPERKFIVHSFGAKDASPYGLGLGSRLFWPVLFKRQDITFWLTFADKFGSPTTVGKYPAGSQPAEVNTLLSAMAAIAQESAIAVPEGMVIEFLEAARGGSIDTYEKLARYMDEQMSEAVLGEVNSNSAKGGGLGSGVAQERTEVRLELTRADADLLSATLNETLVRWISEYNVPGATAPKVWRKVEEPKDLAALSTRDKSIFDMGFRPSLAYITDTYGGEWAEANPPPVPQSGSQSGSQSGPVKPPSGLSAAFADPVDPVRSESDHLEAAAAPLWDGMLTELRHQVDSAPDMATLQRRLTALYGGLDTGELVKLMAAAFALAELKGLSGDAVAPVFAERLWPTPQAEPVRDGMLAAISERVRAWTGSAETQLAELRTMMRDRAAAKEQDKLAQMFATAFADQSRNTSELISALGGHTTRHEIALTLKHGETQRSITLPDGRAFTIKEQDTNV